MKVHQYREMMRWLTRPKLDPSIKQQVASLPFRPFGTQESYGPPEELSPMPNIQDIIREEGIPVGPQVNKDGGRVGMKPGGLVEPGVTHYGSGGQVPVSGVGKASAFKYAKPAMLAGRSILGKAFSWIGADVLFYELDWRNEMSKGKSEKEAKAIAKNNATLGIYKNKEYMNQLKKTAEEMGIDSRAFDQVYNLNLTGSKIQNQKEAYKNRIAKLEAMEATTTEDQKKKAETLKSLKLASANFDKDAEAMMSEGIEKVAGQVSISKAAEVFPTPNLDQIADARYDITQKDFAKPFTGLQGRLSKNYGKKNQMLMICRVNRYTLKQENMESSF